MLRPAAASAHPAASKLLSFGIVACLRVRACPILVAVGFCAVGSCRSRLCAFWKFSSVDSAPNRLLILRTLLFSAVTTALYVRTQNSAVLIFEAEAPRVTDFASSYGSSVSDIIYGVYHSLHDDLRGVESI